MTIKHIIVIIFICFSLFSVGFLFYNEDIKNSLPTAKPTNYKPTQFGVKYDSSFAIKSNKKMKLLHFFNPECPCSKFNVKHIQKLASQYATKVEFVAYSNQKLTDKNYPIAIKFDENGKMAKLYGVYSTPQAVLLDSSGRIIYRGNYNKSRFCGSKNSEFVRIAIEKELKKETNIELMQKSGLPYGCALKLN